MQSSSLVFQLENDTAKDVSNIGILKTLEIFFILR
jgi:hypothetical protein